MGFWSVVLDDSPAKNPEDPVQLEAKTPGLRVKHFTTVPPISAEEAFENIVRKGKKTGN